MIVQKYLAVTETILCLHSHFSAFMCFYDIHGGVASVAAQDNGFIYMTSQWKGNPACMMDPVTWWCKNSLIIQYQLVAA